MRSAGAQHDDSGSVNDVSGEFPPSNAADVAASLAAGRSESLLPSRLAARMRLFFGVAIAARWQVGAELARTLGALGLLREASRLFEELELWEECVAAMGAMGHREEAEQTVRSRLEAAPTAGMWVQLGDLTGDASCYETAWSLSRGTCARAKLKLGSIAMQGERWDEARQHLKEALAVKAHYAEAWYCCAVCLLKGGDTDGALPEMRKVVALDPSHHQAWSSLGGLFAKKRMKREALFAFREACKLRGDSWELWQHTALAALDLGRFDEAVHAAGMSMKFGGPPAPQVSSLVAQAVAKDVKDTADGERTQRRLLPKARALLEQSCQVSPTELAHWEARLHLEDKCGDADGKIGVLVAQLDATKAHTEWTADPAALDAVAEVAAQLVEAQLETAALAHFKAARKLVDDLLYAASEKLAASPGCESLRMLAARIKRHDEDDFD